MIGLVLQGGGAQGGYHMGVVKALKELDIEIGAITGTSVGALNGAILTQGDYDQALALWEQMDPRMLFNEDPEVYNELVKKKLNLKNTHLYFEFLRKIIKQKGLDIEPLTQMIQEYVDEDRVRDSQIDFGLVTVSLTDWKAMEIFVSDMPEGSLGDYLLASSFLPAFSPKHLQGKRFIDGAFHDNLPINLISKKEVTEIVAVELQSIGIVQPPKDKQLKIRRIVPSGELGSILEFDAAISKLNIQMGYLDTMKSYGHFEGNRYFLTHVPDESYFQDKIDSVTEEQIVNMADVIGYLEGYPKRLLYEIILPELANLLGLPITASYKAIIMGGLELLADSMGLERLRAYDYESFSKAVILLTGTEEKKKRIVESLPAPLMRSTLLKKTLKEQVLRLWFEIIILGPDSGTEEN